MACWLLIERLENWEIDKQEGFKRFGLSKRYRNRASQIKKGDLLISYVSSGISCLADIREVTADGTTNLPYGGNYDTAYPISISTKPYLILDRRFWIPLQQFVNQLSLTAGKRDWRQVIRTSLLALTDKDSRLIIDGLKRNFEKNGGVAA